MKSLGFRLAPPTRAPSISVHIHDLCCIGRLHTSAVLYDHLISNLFVRKVLISVLTDRTRTFPLPVPVSLFCLYR